MDFNYEDIKNAYKKAGVTKGRVVLLKTDIRYLGVYDHEDQTESLAAHFNILSDYYCLNPGEDPLSLTLRIRLCAIRISLLI